MTEEILIGGNDDSTFFGGARPVYGTSDPRLIMKLEKKRMTEATGVDLSTCEEGDILVSKHGLELTYVSALPKEEYYDHLVKYPNGSFGTRLHDGHTYKNPDRRLETDHDIVEIRKKND